PLISVFSQKVYSKSPQIRIESFSYLQKTLLALDIEDNLPLVWSECFEFILFPLLKELTRTEILNLDIQGILQIRLKCLTLACKVFLQRLLILSQIDSFYKIWNSLLSYFQIYSQINNSSQKEAIRESLKNVLLVTQTSNLLSTDQWNDTWQFVETIFSGLKEEVCI
ncbi:hypothetical protein ROZALSC1DRAFT_6077, partial [Rozella allomycis CSF55]